MNTNIEIIIGTARGFCGITESPAGSNNVIFNTHYYGRTVSGSAYPWCMAFVWDIFRMTGLSGLFFGGGKTATCAELYNYAKRNGQFVDKLDLARGDVVLYNFGRTGAVADHTGFVVSSTARGLVTIEGNTSTGSNSNGGEVMERSRDFANVVGAYRPHYGDDAALAFGYDDFVRCIERYMNPAGTGDAHSEWATAAVEKMLTTGIVVGNGGNDFGWKRPVTKETTAQMLSNLLAVLDRKEE